ncbi:MULTISPECIES: branched-chain amino acid ABC transporter permease [Acidithrix]|uniref:Leucine/isoleucine/valine transporter permease subunit n=1 Tax=Acidithrix ferrooxidans TaxID=1280514 RepID=A0A0D8HG22_9ACTN|nr:MULTISPECIES: branched-chain amino acid ABC transporter permease [Acidithrix]KJF16858.1 leucine/isoleucine/valine transporter permease subunit [Acidithrix ferrooxidans]CAG4932119.1 unnamed protein product [Acidithrix sp. C25]
MPKLDDLDLTLETGSKGKKLISPAIAALVPIVAFAVGVHLYSNELLLTYMAIYIALAQGINIIYGFTGYLPFGYFGFFGVGAYASGLVMLDYNVPPVLAVIIGGVAGALVGAILLPLFRLRGAYFAIGTLAASEAIYTIISNPSLQSITNGPYGLNLAGFYSSGTAYGTAIALAALSILATSFVRSSKFGLTLKAIRDDSYSASMAGVNVPRQRFYAWLIAAAIAGMAGSVFGWSTSVFYPQAVFDPALSVLAIVFALFGGVGTIWGPTIGTVVLYAIYNAIGVSNPQYFQLIYGMVIVLLVLFAPRGLAGFWNYITTKITTVRAKND